MSTGYGKNQIRRAAEAHELPSQPAAVPPYQPARAGAPGMRPD